MATKAPRARRNHGVRLAEDDLTRLRNLVETEGLTAAVRTLDFARQTVERALAVRPLQKATHELMSKRLRAQHVEPTGSA